MQVIKIISETVDMDITGITLLSGEEYEKYKSRILPLDGLWWLRSPGGNAYSVMLVHYNGNVFDHGCRADYDYVFVRPALKIKGPGPSILEIEDRFMAGGYTWTVISENLAICDDFIGQHCFREAVDADDANDYGASDIKKFIEGWCHKALKAPTLS